MNQTKGGEKIITGKVGYLYEKEVGLFSATKKRVFAMMKVAARELEIYQKGDDMGKVGEPKGNPKNVFKFSKALLCRDVNEKGNVLGRYVFELSDPSSGKIQFGCDTEDERREWTISFQQATLGFQPSGAQQEELLKKRKDSVKAKVAPTYDVFTLPIECQEQIRKVESLCENGLLTIMERDQLIPVIVANGKEALLLQSGGANPPSYAPDTEVLMAVTVDENHVIEEAVVVSGMNEKSDIGEQSFIRTLLGQTRIPLQDQQTYIDIFRADNIIDRDIFESFLDIRLLNDMGIKRGDAAQIISAYHSLYGR